MNTNIAKNIKVYPYKATSESAKLLANALGIKRIKHTDSNYKDTTSKVIINFGSSNIPYTNSFIINKPERVAIAGNKEFTFSRLQNVCNIPKYTTDVSEAKSWEGVSKIVCRETVTSYGGKGIKVYDFDVFKDITNNNLTQYVFFSEYIKKTRECRVHIVDGKVILVQAKKLRRDSGDNEERFLIRNYDNGWVFSSNHGLDNEVLGVLKSESLKAIKAVGLDFGAVDIIYNQVKGVYILEINTAPGLSDASLEYYRSAFESLVTWSDTNE